MKRICMIFLVGFVSLNACQKNELDQELLELETPGPEEFFRAEVDGELFETRKAADIGGTVYPSWNTGVINFDFSGEMFDESKDHDSYKAFVFKICFYDGEGTYYTGTDKTVSWAMYWFDDELWENHYSYGNEPGEVVITNATEEFVEGSFQFEAYNPHLETTVRVEGEFGLRLESFEEYQQ